MAMKNYFFLYGGPFVLSILPNAPSLAQGSDPHIWNQYYTNYKLSKKCDLKSDVSLRSHDTGKSWDFFLIRAGILYHVSDKFKVNTSLAYTHNSNTSKTEHRVHVETTYRKKVGKKVRFMARLRQEGRFFNTNDEGNGDDTFKLRTRVRSQITIPLNRVELKKGTVYCAFAEELFVHVIGDLDHDYFDQNRVVAGVGYYLNDNLNLGLAYNYQLSKPANSSDIDQTDVAWITVKHKLR